jgi:hypothetical protein
VLGGKCGHRSRVVEVAAKWPLAVDGLAGGKCGGDELSMVRTLTVTATTSMSGWVTICSWSENTSLIPNTSPAARADCAFWALIARIS